MELLGPIAEELLLPLLACRLGWLALWQLLAFKGLEGLDALRPEGELGSETAAASGVWGSSFSSGPNWTLPCVRLPCRCRFWWVSGPRKHLCCQCRV